MDCFNVEMKPDYELSLKNYVLAYAAMRDAVDNKSCMYDDQVMELIFSRYNTQCMDLSQRRLERYGNGELPDLDSMFIEGVGGLNMFEYSLLCSRNSRTYSDALKTKEKIFAYKCFMEIMGVGQTVNMV